MRERLMAGTSRPSHPDVSRFSPPPANAAGTVLAFDYGDRRVGVAVGDSALCIAHPLEGIAVQGEARLAAIAKLVAEWHPVRLVVGMPLADEGAPHPLAARVRGFARRLEARFQLPVSYVDERYSSVDAEARLRSAYGARRAVRAARTREIDSVAAQLLLEQYFAESGK
jgi:putative Holliday junction resolvase